MPAKEEEKLVAYLKEHVPYEREMLGFTFKEMHETPPGLKWNMAFEAFCIHARNLYDFLRHEGSKTTTFRADDYVPNRSKSEAELLFNNLDTFLFHMSTGRIDKKKVNLADVQQLGKWLDEHWASWVSSLKAPYTAFVDADPVCPPDSSPPGYPRRRHALISLTTVWTLLLVLQIALSFCIQNLLSELLPASISYRVVNRRSGCASLPLASRQETIRPTPQHSRNRP